jgi:hypothetical protein
MSSVSLPPEIALRVDEVSRYWKLRLWWRNEEKINYRGREQIKRLDARISSRDRLTWRVGAPEA